MVVSARLASERPKTHQNFRAATGGGVARVGRTDTQTPEPYRSRSTSRSRSKSRQAKPPQARGMSRGGSRVVTENRGGSREVKTPFVKRRDSSKLLQSSMGEGEMDGEIKSGGMGAPEIESSDQPPPLRRGGYRPRPELEYVFGAGTSASSRGGSESDTLGSANTSPREDERNMEEEDDEEDDMNLDGMEGGGGSSEDDTASYDSDASAGEGGEDTESDFPDMKGDTEDALTARTLATDDEETEPEDGGSTPLVVKNRLTAKRSETETEGATRPTKGKKVKKTRRKSEDFKRRFSAISISTASERSEPTRYPAVHSIVPPGEKASTGLQGARFPGRPASVHFQVDPSSSEQGAQLKEALGKKYGLYYMIHDNVNAVRHAFKRAGFRHLISGHKWNVLWGKPLQYSAYSELSEYQKVNHFPGAFEIGRKDCLYKNLLRMRRHQNLAAVDFLPRTFILPGDYRELVEDMSNSSSSQKYIVKPCASSQGRGVKVVGKNSNIPKDKQLVVQSYISDVHLIDGYKYDLRVYAAVTSFEPLRIYMYKEGLTRFCTEKYKKNSKCRYSNLTNYSVQKGRGKFIENEDADVDNYGSKWSITAWRKWMEQQGLDPEPIWLKIKDIIVKSFIAVESKVNTKIKMHVPHRNNCFEVFGFDVLIDAKLKPWILEVNTCPSLASTSPLDKRIKAGVVTDLFNMLCVVPYDKKRYREEMEIRKLNRLRGLEKKTVSANDKKRRNLSKNNDESTIFDHLGEEALEILQESEEEMARRGGYERLFPDPANVDEYTPLFETKKYLNILLAEWSKKREKKAFAGFLYRQPGEISAMSPERTSTAAPGTIRGALGNTRRIESAPSRDNGGDIMPMPQNMRLFNRIQNRMRSSGRGISTVTLHDYSPAKDKLRNSDGQYEFFRNQQVATAWSSPNSDKYGRMAATVTATDPTAPKSANSPLTERRNVSTRNDETSRPSGDSVVYQPGAYKPVHSAVGAGRRSLASEGTGNRAPAGNQFKHLGQLKSTHASNQYEWMNGRNRPNTTATMSASQGAGVSIRMVAPKIDMFRGVGGQVANVTNALPNISNRIS